MTIRCCIVQICLCLLVLPAQACKSKAAPIPKIVEPEPDVQLPEPTIEDRRKAREVLESVASAYRLSPDRRFIKAFPEIDRMFGSDPQEPTIAYDEEKWTLGYKGTRGELTELPDFEQLYAPLREYASEVAEELALEPAEGKPSPPPDPGADSIEALVSLNNDWEVKKRDAGQVRRAAQAMIRLQVGLHDPMGTADRVTVKALALLAMAEATNGEDMAGEKALLARVLGYEASASKIARALPEDDPVRAYTDFDEKTLGKRSGLACSLMHVDLLADQGAEDEAGLRLKKLSGGHLPVLGRRLVRDPSRELALDVIQAVVQELRTTAGEASTISRGVLENPELGLLPFLETELERLGMTPAGPFVDRTIVEAYYRAFLLTGLNVLGRDANDRLGSTVAATQFAKYLGRGKGDLGKQYIRYYMDSIAALETELTLETLVADIRELSLFGPQGLYPLCSSRAHDEYEPAVYTTAREFVTRSDSRVEHRTFLSTIARDCLLDMVMSERLMRSVIDEALHSHLSTRLLLALLEGDRDRLAELLADPRLTSEARVMALEHLRKTNLVDRQIIREQYEGIAGSDWTMLQSYLSFLEEEKDDETALGLLMGSKDVERTAAASRVLRRSGKLDDAWKLVSPLLPKKEREVLVEGARVRLAMNMIEEAENIANACLESHPHPDSIALVVRIFWEQDRHREASTLLADPPVKLAKQDWLHRMAPEFTDAFKNRAVDDAKKAFDWLAGTGVDPQNLLALTDRIDELGHHELAFHLKSILKMEGNDALMLRSSTYGSLEKAKGSEEALAWLKKSCPEDAIDPMSQFGYELGHDEIAWELTPDPDPSLPYATFIWLMRAAAYIRTGAENTAWRKKLEAHYEKPSLDFYDLLGRYLLVKADEAQVWSQVKTPDQHAEACYYLGLRAQREGDYARAIAWYRASTETGLVKEGEPRWSFAQLSEWHDLEMSVERLEEARK